MLSLAHRLTVDANETARQVAKDLLRYINLYTSEEAKVQLGR